MESDNNDIESLYESISNSIEEFMDKYSEYMQLNFDEPSSDSIKYFFTVETYIKQNYPDIQKKIKQLKEKILKAGGRYEREYHKKLVKKEETFNKYVSKFLKKDEENHTILDGLNVDKIIEKEKKMKSNNSSNNNSSNTQYNNNENEFILEQEQLERSQQQLYKLKEIIHKKDYNILGCSDKEQQEMNEILADLQDLMGITEQKVQEGGMQINEIEQAIAETEEKIALAKEELRTAARANVDAQNIKAVLTGAAAGGAIGALNIPVIGPVLGVIGGGFIGKLYAKLNKKALKKIEDKYKAKKEKKHKEKEHKEKEHKEKK